MDNIWVICAKYARSHTFPFPLIVEGTGLGKGFPSFLKEQQPVHWRRFVASE